ncbi:hypothetical protein LOAG_16724 [Loa loa]|uniref:Uncharacterized protein n=1 Tax=Loa loa TaxID=7209 RepID=A0A1S0UKP5_LOALO|nr:hypothetical protein LOAG_16724 [Loa loa]EJD76292.1 hypothetical protein LOAG_16724 [Loa loa]
MVHNDLLCNNGSEFVCICQQNAGNLLKHHILCNELIELDELPVIEMNIRRVNLSARLHTNETYESYFKRRVATIVSNYCEQRADECMATTLRLKKENVVLLSIKPSNLQSTTIDFVITKSQRRNTLSIMTILDPAKVKYILSSQLAALSRILGGVRIEQVKIAIMEKYRESNDGKSIQRNNFGLLLILSVVATFLTITYTIAAVRVCRDCYAKRQAKKNASKLNNAFEMPNYGTCIQPKQNEMDGSYEVHSTIKTRTSKENDQNNPNPGEVTVMDAYQMRRMFQCDPSQLPAEEVSPLSQTSNDLFVIFALKSLKEPKSQICGPQPKHTIHQSIKVGEEKKNSPLPHKINKTSQENEDIAEVPQKYTNILATNKQTAEETSHYDSNPTTYFRQAEYEFFEQQFKELPTSISNQVMIEESLKPTCNQPEVIPELMNSNLKGPTIDEQLETTSNQPAIGNETAWLPNIEPRGKPYSLTSSFSESLYDVANHYNEGTINLELYQSNQETKHRTETEISSPKRVSLTNQLNYLQETESSDYFAKDAKSIHFVEKSRSTHQFDNWSSESDDEDGDIYHKLSEVEEERETERSSKFVTVSCVEKAKDFIGDPTNSRNEKHFELNLNMQSSICKKQFKVIADEPCYEQL